MNNGEIGNRGVMLKLDRMHRECSPSNSGMPTLMRQKNAPVAGVADLMVRRCYLMREARRKNLVAAAERSLFERQVAQKFFSVASDIFELEVWLQFPELAGRPIVVYDDWSIGPEVSDTETHDLFNPLETKRIETRTRDIVSTRSDNIRLDRSRFAYPDPAPRR